LTPLISGGQNLIGYTASEIGKYMRTYRSEMNKEETMNKSFRYLKYSDNHDSQTLLFFLNSDSVCTNIRIVCNNSSRDSRIKELDSAYTKLDDNVWRDTRAGKNYLVKLKEEEWSFSITIEPEK
jgi:hypothetical protein